jgi:hypothetical protein
MSPLCNSGMSLSCKNERTALCRRWRDDLMLRCGFITADIREACSNLPVRA